MAFDLNSLKIEAENEIKKANTLVELEATYRKYLGKKGKLTSVFESLGALSKERRSELGKEANQTKVYLEGKFQERKSAFSKEEALDEEWVDITAPGILPKTGHLHPLTLVRRKFEEIFGAMGFEVVEGPEVENEYYNFDALNIQRDHPARDLWDTLWLESEGKDKFLLRTHTSPVQIHYMEKHQPPFRIIAPGRVFRHEATDASHDVQFNQVEGLMVGKDISVANFKAVIQEFFSRFFSKEIKVRLRPSFFPFVEPGFEVDMSCLACGGKGCSACKQSGWLEIMGAGMVHPFVLKSAGINPDKWQGFAFGMGMDRLAMMKYKINDIRLFYSGDLRFLEQF